MATGHLKVPQPVKIGSTFAEDWEAFKDDFEILLMTIDRLFT